MKTSLVTAMVLGIAAMVANAAITVTCVKTGTYTVTTGVGVKVVDVYTITGDSDGVGITAYWACAKGPLFQAWRADPNYDEEDTNIIGWISRPSPTLTGANLLTATQKDADTHFLHSDAQYLLTPFIPTETNDLSFGYIEYPNSTRRYFGVGTDSIDIGTDPNNVYYYQDLSFAGTCALLTDYQSTTVPFLQIATIPGPAWIHVWGEVGGAYAITAYDYWIPAIPEPVTMTLLALGGIAVLRRKRK